MYADVSECMRSRDQSCCRSSAYWHKRNNGSAKKKGERRFIVIANDVGREKLNAAWQMGPVHAASEPVP